MKKLFFISLLLTYSFPASAELNIFACEPEWAALSQELGGDDVVVYSATTGLQDPHYIQARPSLIAKARKADLLVCTGAELEVGWLPLLQSKSANPMIQNGADGYFMATDYVSLLNKPTHIDRSQGDVHSAGNPHIQTDPHQILKVGEALTLRLQQLDMNRKAAYEQRWSDFKQRWASAIVKWEKQAEPLINMPIVTQHDNWVYMIDWLHLNRVANMESKPGVPPTINDLNTVVNTLDTSPAKAIIYAAYQPSKASDWLADKTGVPKARLPYTVGGDASTTDLFSLFDNTLMLLLKVQK